MTPRTVVLTGASSGIGAAAATAIAARGHHVVPLGRDPERTRAVAASIGAEAVLVDLADLATVRRAAAELLALPDRIDVLALHAGAMIATRSVTPDGIETTFQTNHLGHFLLERLLHERLLEDRALVVVTCSLAVHLGTVQRNPGRYGMLRAYADAKLAGLLFARELARRTRGTGMTAVAFHPGTTNTRFADTAGGWLGAQSRATAPIVNRMPGILNPQQGAATLVRLASTPTPRGLAAHYLGPTGREAMLPRLAHDRRLAAWSWDRSEELAGL